LHAPKLQIAGHRGVARVGECAGKRVAAFAGRAHLYAGFDPKDVTYLVRLAAACGAKTIVLTNAAGGLNHDYERGTLMLIADHINLTGATPLGHNAPDPFLAMTGAYAPHLREVARAAAEGATLPEGIYAGVRGPQYETPAESEALRRLGADAVGMSTVLETIAARALGLDVLGISLITNAAGGQAVSHADVLAASAENGERVARLVESVISAL
jgi:purine-nucleoside phosphorylase